jgi:diaminopimelate decarboxylase
VASPKADVHNALNRILSEPVPELSPDALQAFVAPYFEHRRHYLDAVQTHGSPLYFLDTAALKTKAVRLKAAFDQVFSSVGYYYAVKSNNHPDVARTLLACGFGLDVSSGLELETALELGARQIVFSGPGKAGHELLLAVMHADKVVVLMDSPGELERLAAVAARLKQTVRCGVRLTVNPNGLWRKFGIPLDTLADFCRAADQHPYIRLTGLQFHASWNLSPQTQIAFIEKLGKTMGKLPPPYQKAVEFVDIGGGYWPEQGEWLHPDATPAGRVDAALGHPPEHPRPHHCLPAAAIETFAEQLGAAVRKHLFSVIPCRICIEPGRWLSHEAMHLLVTVVDKKAPDLVITDAGTNAVGWERFENDYFPVLNLTRPALTETPCHILGSLCTPHDVWGYFYLGAAIEAGDILMIPTQGAYTYSLRQNFIKPLPKVVTAG